MPRGEPRLLRRADARAVVASGLVLVVVLALQGLALYAYAAKERLEEADEWMEQLREMAETVEARELPDASLADAMYAALPGGMRAVRIHRADGGIGSSLGKWPAPERRLAARREGDPDRSIAAFHLLRADGFLVDSIGLPSGSRLELALPLRRFARPVASRFTKP